MTTIAVDSALCCGDALCVRACPAGCFRMKDGKAAAVPMAEKTCIECGHCVAVCPKDAIALNGELPPGTPEHRASFEDLAALLQTRRSIRNYKEDPVPRAELERILDIARYAPTGKNSQDVQWLGVDGRDNMRTLTGRIIDVLRPHREYARLVESFDQGGDPVFRGAGPLRLLYGAGRD